MVEVKKLHMEKHYKSSNISFSESGGLSKSLKVFIAFLSLMVDLTFSKILNIWGRVTVGK